MKLTHPKYSIRAFVKGACVCSVCVREHVSRLFSTMLLKRPENLIDQHIDKIDNGACENQSAHMQESKWKSSK